MRKRLMDRHKQWIMNGWHAMCLRSTLIDNFIGHEIYKTGIPKHNTNKSRTRMNTHHHSLDRKAPGGSSQHIDEEHNKKGSSGPASRPYHEHEGQVPSAHEDHGHDEHPRHYDHHAHHAHMVADFRRRFLGFAGSDAPYPGVVPYAPKILGATRGYPFFRRPLPAIRLFLHGVLLWRLAIS
jgi:hypothetical protein